jgi:hypothetical protein
MSVVSLCIRFSLVLLVLLFSASSSFADVIYGLTDSQSLIRFPATHPGSFHTIGPLTGGVPQQTVVAIDFRPKDGTLFALSYNNQTGSAQLYTVNRTTGKLKRIGEGLSLDPGPSIRYSIDFHPVDGTLRAIGGSGGNYVLDSNTGAILSQGAAPFQSNGQAIVISGTGFSNNRHGAKETIFYAYNYLSDQLVQFTDLDGGETSVIGHSGLYTMTASMGFDISGKTGIAYLNADIDFSQTDSLYKINLNTGAASKVGSFGVPIADISVQPDVADTVVVETPIPGAWILLASALPGIWWLSRKQDI